MLSVVPYARFTLTRLWPYRHEQICSALRRDYVLRRVAGADEGEVEGGTVAR
jgi:hypothetical protein